MFHSDHAVFLREYRGLKLKPVFPYSTKEVNHSRHYILGALLRRVTLRPYEIRWIRPRYDILLPTAVL
jgi:hypothetical protein